MPGDHKRSGPSATKRPPHVVPPGTEAMVSHRGDRQRARERLAEQRRRAAISTELETLAPLSGPDGYYKAWAGAA